MYGQYSVQGRPGERNVGATAFFIDIAIVGMGTAGMSYHRWHRIMTADYDDGDRKLHTAPEDGSL